MSCSFSLSITLVLRNVRLRQATKYFYDYVMRGINEITVVIGGVIKTNYRHTGDVISACHKVALLVALIITRLSSNNRSVGTDYVIIVILYFVIFSLPLANLERKSTNCDLQHFLALKSSRSLFMRFLFRKK